MSNAYLLRNNTTPPPGSVIKLTPDLGPAVTPDGSGNINLTGLPTGAGDSVNDSNFETFNAGTSTMQFAYRYKGSGTTVGASTVTLITIPVTVASVMNIDAQVSGIEATPLGVGGQVRGTVFKAGAGNAIILPGGDFVLRSSDELSNCVFAVGVDGTGNNLIVTVTGVAGRTIEWYAIGWIVQQSFI